MIKLKLNKICLRYLFGFALAMIFSTTSFGQTIVYFDGLLYVQHDTKVARYLVTKNSCYESNWHEIYEGRNSFPIENENVQFYPYIHPHGSFYLIKASPFPESESTFDTIGIVLFNSDLLLSKTVYFGNNPLLAETPQVDTVTSIYTYKFYPIGRKVKVSKSRILNDSLTVEEHFIYHNGFLVSYTISNSKAEPHYLRFDLNYLSKFERWQINKSIDTEIKPFHLDKISCNVYDNDRKLFELFDLDFDYLISENSSDTTVDHTIECEITESYGENMNASLLENLYEMLAYSFIQNQFINPFENACGYKLEWTTIEKTSDTYGVYNNFNCPNGVPFNTPPSLLNLKIITLKLIPL